MKLSITEAEIEIDDTTGAASVDVKRLRFDGPAASPLGQLLAALTAQPKPPAQLTSPPKAKGK
jgi:hypothetical protein